MPERFRYIREIRTSFAAGKTRSLFPVLPEKGKPHQEQSQAARRLPAGQAQVDCPKEPETAVLDRWQQPGRLKAAGNRTRLMVYRFFY